MSSVNRREWLAAGAAGFSEVLRTASSDIPYRPLGDTGVKVSIIP